MGTTVFIQVETINPTSYSWKAREKKLLVKNRHILVWDGRVMSYKELSMESHAVYVKSLAILSSYKQTEDFRDDVSY